MEAFDDDTEFELPGISPLSGTQLNTNTWQKTMAQSTAAPSDLERHAAQNGEEDGPHKHWTCVYPIYIDAKRRYRHGCRRVAYEKAALFPSSQIISNAAQQLRLAFVHEPYRCHPQDWENPGRVKIQLHKEDGTLQHANLPTKEQKLLEALAAQLQTVAGGVPPAVPTTHGKNNTRPQNVLRARQRKIQRVAYGPRLPANSPALPSGLINMDLSKMAGGGLQNMGPLGGMMSSMGLGDDDDDKPDDANTPAQKPAPALGRRQRKRVVRIGR
ncbi:signal recognition particle subunit [Malassezia vespertilionis]|uniref:signal recognition particle subunit n=1 Tax=Malassezia vespertilionis TaxID=2020962 RepID=UPI0024B1498B|nr:signal recognition particle subunit [Malassezia vespertilionis]WFD08046.1 signal recognition particle subunit [Malassezia vespertilionis]